jgi:DNA mismatch endonuclease (patch repair protein)
VGIWGLAEATFVCPATQPEKSSLAKIKSPSFSGLSPASIAASRSKRATGKRDTSPEILLRRELARMGLRYRTDVGALPGRPDVVLARARIALFCDGDFWHGHNWRAQKAKLSRGTNGGYWLAKIGTNRKRDRRHNRVLQQQGWLVLRVWESTVKANPTRVGQLVARLAQQRVRQSERGAALSAGILQVE